ncbi:hypothetical protein J6590_058268 [Homalodisca vitripennis]|nr:hypothetical protein J6590_058268 [Homalodisca vitripennis]
MNSIEKRNIMDLLKFRTSISDHLINVGQTATIRKKRGRPASTEDLPSHSTSKERTREEVQPSKAMRRDTVDHLPEVDSKKEATRCKNQNYKGKTHVFCTNTLGEELKIEIRELERGSDNYDIYGHYQYYDEKKYPFDRMDDILYRDRIWMSVFDSSKDVYNEYVANETDNMNMKILHQNVKINVSANCSDNEEDLKIILKYCRKIRKIIHSGT